VEPRISIKEDIKLLDQDYRKNSWDHSAIQTHDSGAYEFITVGKRISENDIIDAPTLIPAITIGSSMRYPSPSRLADVTIIKPPMITAAVNAASSARLKRSNSRANKLQQEAANALRIETAVPPRLETSTLPGLETVVPPRHEVAIARTLSVKRANSTAKQTMVRAPSIRSRDREGNSNSSSPNIPLNSFTPRIVMTDTSSTLSTPIGPSPSVTPRLEQQPLPQPQPQPQPSPRPLLQSSYSMLSQTTYSATKFPQLTRKESTRLEIKKEIWGERKLQGDQVRENRGALMPKMCVVDEEESRRSFFGMIESV
jgi:hypothetical protein